MENRIVIIVSGGNVQGCYADLKNVEIEMIDFDNIQEEGADAVRQAETRAKEVEATMHHVY
ncbi:MAG: hypothetical protein HY289_04890 [Planctomycetes bacterium]|nr:hypothetical protein [Planctomycetota bacterium]